MFWIAFTAQMSAAVPQHHERWFSGNDVPSYLTSQKQNVFIQVPVRVTVRPDGKLQECGVEVSSGIPELDRLTCQLLRGRARFKPAQIDGVPSFGVHRMIVRWAVADSPSELAGKPDLADIDVVVEHLPSGLKSPARVGIMFLVSEDGTTSSCAGNATSDETVQNDPALVSIACDQIMQQYRATAALDASKKSVTSVQNALVVFYTSRK